MKTVAGEGKKKLEILGPPTFWGPTFRGPFGKLVFYSNNYKLS